MDAFYSKVIGRLLAAGDLTEDMSVLVTCADTLDHETFLDKGFKQVTISNVDRAQEGRSFEPYQWAYHNAEELDSEDNGFDWVVVHLGLHHCREPHKALCEMYRVCRKGLLFIEPCDNLITRLGQRFGVGQSYEVHAVAFHDLSIGGANNTFIPNYVYRWTRGDVEKTIRSYAPEFRHRFKYFNDFVVHWNDLKAKKDKRKLLLALCAYPFLKLMTLLCPAMSNNIAAVVFKADDRQLQPWIERTDAGLQPRQRWFEESIHSYKK